MSHPAQRLTPMPALRQEPTHPHEGEAIRGLLDGKAARGKRFSDAEATLDLRYSDDRTQRSWAERWGWSQPSVCRFLQALRADAESSVNQTRIKRESKNGAERPGSASRESSVNQTESSVNQAPPNGFPPDPPSLTPKLFPLPKRVSKETPKRFPQSESRTRYAFEDFWNDYGYKTGSKKKARQKWRKLSEAERLAIKRHVPRYVAATFTDGRFPSRCYPTTYLNQERWETEPPPIQTADLPDVTESFPADKLPLVRAAYPEIDDGDIWGAAEYRGQKMVKIRPSLAKTLSHA